MTDSVVIERQFRGPPESGNGGYACGLIARFIDGPCEITLRAPPPLDADLRVDRDGEHVRLFAGDTLVVEGKPAPLDIDVPEPVDVALATEAALRFAGFERHPFPSCFVCGPERTVGDGLCIFPGAIEGRAVAAAPWSPHRSFCGSDGHVRDEILWSALDCPSYFGEAAFHPIESAAVLGRLTAQIEQRPRAGEPCVAIGWSLAPRDGRKVASASAIFTESGELVASARATWIVLKT